MRMKPPEDYSTYLLLNRLAEVLFQIRKIDQEQKQRREILHASLRLWQQDQREEDAGTHQS